MIMKKTLRLFLVAALAMVFGNVMADEVTMAYSGSTTTNMTGNNDAALVGLDATKWSVVGAKGAATNFPGLNAAGDFRLYWHKDGSNTITVESLEGVTINTIKMTFTGNNYSNVTVTANGSAVTPNDGVYAINSTSFVLGNGNTTNSQVRIKDLVITYTAGSGDFVAAPIFGVNSGMYFETQYVELSTTTEGADIFYTVNGSEPTASSTKYTEPIAIASTTILKAIAIKGGTNSNVATAEYTIVNTTNKGTAESPFSIADALTVVNALASGATTSSAVYTKGIVVGDVTVNSSGQAQFKIGATAEATENLITVYRAKGLENEAYVAGDTKAGDEVVICAPLQNYNGNTPETSYGYIYSINGATSKADPVLEGDGSETNPFTANDLIIMKTSQRPTGAVWVKGIIRGTYKTKTQLDEDKASNIAIATSTEATEFAPVELKQGSVFREKLNVADNPGNKDKEVLLKGTIDTYFSPATGVKNLVEAKLDSTVITGIDAVKTVDAQFDGKIYNLAGQEVTKSYKGIVIKNGKKVVIK